MKKAVLGIDVGGTKVKTASVFGDGILGKGTTFSVPGGVRPGRLAGMIGEQASFLAARDRIRFTTAGAGCPGHVANDGRTLLYAPNLGWRKTGFAALLENELSVPVTLENDVNAAALGEHLYGAGQGARNVICVFVGTGIGGGIITGGRLLKGTTGNAAEVGHTVFRPGGRACSCGRRGCAEAYAGGAHIPARYAQLGGRKGLDAAQIWRLARGGDRRAGRVAADAVEALVALVVSLQTLFDAERIVLGGGVIEHVSGLYREIKTGVARCLVGPWKSKVKILRSKLGSNAGILGAAALARKV